jgi:hypothetical protein
VPEGQAEGPTLTAAERPVTPFPRSQHNDLHGSTLRLPVPLGCEPGLNQPGGRIGENPSPARSDAILAEGELGGRSLRFTDYTGNVLVDERRFASARADPAGA